MTATLTLDRCQNNTADEPEHLVIHGPSWTNRMPFDDHAKNVVLPALKGWLIRRHPLGWIEAVTPWRPEALQ